MADEAVNPEPGTGEPLSMEDAAGLLFESDESLKANSEGATQEAPAPEKEQPEPVDPDEDLDITEDVQEEPEDADGTYEVKVNGETKKVTLDELRKGYSLESDYRKKTAELSEERSKIDSEYQALQTERQQQAQRLDGLLPQLQTALQGKWADVDWSTLARENPAEYVARREEYNQDVSKFNAGLQERQRLQSQMQEDQKKRSQEIIQRETELLKEVIPDFADPEKGAAKKAEYTSYLKGMGYDDDAIATINDHRMLVIIDKAIRYEKAMERAAKAKAGAAKAPPVSQPGARRRDGAKADAVATAQNRLKRTGSVEDAAQLLIERGIL